MYYDDEQLAENLGNDLIRSTRALRPRLTREEIDEINSVDVMSNYVKDLTDRSYERKIVEKLKF